LVRLRTVTIPEGYGKLQDFAGIFRQTYVSGVNQRGP